MLQWQLQAGSGRSPGSLCPHWLCAEEVLLVAGPGRQKQIFFWFFLPVLDMQKNGLSSGGIQQGKADFLVFLCPHWACRGKGILVAAPGWQRRVFFWFSMLIGSKHSSTALK